MYVGVWKLCLFLPDGLTFFFFFFKIVEAKGRLRLCVRGLNKDSEGFKKPLQGQGEGGELPTSAEDPADIGDHAWVLVPICIAVKSLQTK